MRKPDEPTASTEARDEESFYGRWSRRKRRARDGGLRDEAPAAAPPAAGVPAEPSPDEARALTDADMPPLESLGEDDDYSGFMSPGVSEALRNQALRKLFASSQFNVLDGLNDYDDDFTKFEPLGDIITADMRHQMELQAERAKREAEEQARAMMAEGGEDAPAADDGRRAEAGAGDDAEHATATGERSGDDPHTLHGDLPRDGDSRTDDV